MIDQNLENSIEKKLKDAFKNEEIQIRELPNHDRMVQLRSIEEALNEFDCDPNSEQSLTYVISVPKSSNHKKVTPPAFNLKQEDTVVEFELNPDVNPDHLFSTLVNETFFQTEKNSQKSNPKYFQDNEPIYTPNGKLNVNYLLENAEILFQNKEFSLARNIYSTIFQQGEKQGLALYWMGRCFEAEANDVEATAHYKQSLIYHPSPETFTKLSNLFIKNKQYDEAIENLHRYLKEANLTRNIRNSTYHQIADINIIKNNYKEALENYRKAIDFSDKTSKNFIQIYEKIANISAHLKLYGDSNRTWNELLLHDQNNIRYLMGIANNYLAIGEKEKAFEYFVKALNQDITQIIALFHCVKLAYELRSFSKVEILLLQFIKEQPFNAQVLYTLAGIQHQLGKFPQSAENCKMILNIQPKHMGALELLNLNQQLGGAQ